MRNKLVNIFAFLFVCIIYLTLKLNECSAMDCINGHVKFNNPCYRTYSDISEIVIPNGSMVNFSAKGIIGKTIRDFSGVNQISNPFGVTHSGLALNNDPRSILEIINNQTPSMENGGIGCTIPEKAGILMRNELMEYYGDILSITDRSLILRPFLLEANGSIEQVIKGVYPHVQIHPFINSLEHYEGNVSIRLLDSIIATESSRVFISETIGRSYEAFSSIHDLILATKARNKEEDTSRFFCSELSGYFYKKNGILSRDINVSNILPEQLSSGAGRFDLLKEIAARDLELKHLFDMTKEEAEGDTCCGELLKGLLCVFVAVNKLLLIVCEAYCVNFNCIASPDINISNRKTPMDYKL